MSLIHLEELADDLKNIYQLNPPGSEAMIEKYLEERLKGLSPDERLPFMEKLSQALEENKPLRPSISYQSLPDLHENAQGLPDLHGNAQGLPDLHGNAQGLLDFPGCGPSEIPRLFSLLLGKESASQDISSTELLTKLSSSLNTIYNTLDQIADTIDTTLLGRRTDAEPASQFIDSVFDKTEQSTSLKDYLDRIKDAFLIAQQAFRQAVHSRVGEILFDLNPERLEAATSRGLKFGPMRKAELFEIYKEKYQACQRWFEAGHLVEEVFREFERNCQKIYYEKGNEIKSNS
jgi:hypothetical protein